ncbi:hypothetical protein C8F01DRAFT_100158 [Mycena amicta]|nr:hypothetical protein C8F01DRAFT_100158 [Mycena amicta]
MFLRSLSARRCKFPPSLAYSSRYRASRSGTTRWRVASVPTPRRRSSGSFLFETSSTFFSSPMSLSALPVRELWETIIDHLHDSPPSLNACALTCRTFTSRAQAHIFHTIHVPVDPLDCGAFDQERIAELRLRMKRYQQLSNLLLSSPNTAFLVSRIRRLEIHSSSLEIITLFAGIPWTNVHTLRLKNVPHLPEIISAVQSLVSTASLEELELRFAPTVYGGYRLTPAHFSAILCTIAAGVRVLSLGLCNPYPLSSSQLHSALVGGQSAPRIRILQLDHSPGIISLLLALSSEPDAVIDCNFLHTLHLKGSWSAALDSFLIQCGQNVEELYLAAYDEGIANLRLDYLPSLTEVVCPNAADWESSSVLMRSLPRDCCVRLQANLKHNY